MNLDANDRQLLHNVPRFLERFQSRHAMAGKLKDITEKIIRHVNAIYWSSSLIQQHRLSAPDPSAIPDQTQVQADHSQSMGPLDMPSTSTDATFDLSLDSLPPLPDDFFLDPGFDWFSWCDQMNP